MKGDKRSVRKMEGEKKRVDFLRNYFSTKFINAFKEGIPKETADVLGSGISYEEAVDVLEYTISHIGEMRILF